MNFGRILHMEVALGSCESVRMHSAVDYWTCPVAVPMRIVGVDGLMLVHGAPLAR